MRTDSGQSKILSIVLSLAMVLSSVPTDAVRAYAEELDNVETTTIVEDDWQDDEAIDEAESQEATSDEEIASSEGAVQTEEVPPIEEAPVVESVAPTDDSDVSVEYDDEGNPIAVTLQGGATESSEAAEQLLLALTDMDNSEASETADALFPEQGDMNVTELTAQAENPHKEGDAENRSLDGSNIENISVKWITPDTIDNGDKDLLYRKPKKDEKQSVRMRINYALSGEYNYNPYDVTIRIPANMFKNRAGENYGTIVLPYPEEPLATASFNCKLVGDYWEFSNTGVLRAASKGYFEVEFIDMFPHELVDMQESEDFDAYIEVVTNKGNIIGLRSNAITAQFDMEAVVTTVSKRVSSGSPKRVPASDIPENQRIEGEEEYVKVDWYVWGVTEANTVYILDQFDSIPQDAEVYTDSKGVKHTEADMGGFIVGGSTSATTELEAKGVYTGYVDGLGSYYYYSTAYPASQFQKDTNYVFHNAIQYTVTEVDPEVTDPVNPNVNNGDPDPQRKTTARSSARVVWSYSDPKWYNPQGHFMVYKNGNDDKYQHGTARHNYTHNSSRTASDLHRNSWGWYGIYLSGLNDLQDANAENGDDGSIRLSYTVNSIGYAMPWMFDENSYSVDGNEVAARLSRNYNRAVTMTTSDEGISIGRYGEKLELGTDYDLVSVEFPNAPILYYGKPKNINPDGSWRANSYDDGTFSYTEDGNKSHWPDVKLQALVGGEWVDLATASWKTGNRVVTKVDGSTVEDGVVDLPAGTENFRSVVTLQNTSTDERANICLQAAIDYDVRVVVALKSTAELTEQINELFVDNNQPTMQVWNEARMVVTQDDTSATIYNDTQDGYDMMGGYTVDTMVYPSKSAEYKVDYNDRHVKITYTGRFEERSLIADKDAYDQAIQDGRLVVENHGWFYDLLPKGVTPDTESIRLREGDAIVDVKVDPDWNGTGRSLLTVEADLVPQPKRYRSSEFYYYEDVPTITFDAYYNFEDVLDYGSDLHNVIAFESSNDSIGTIDMYSGEPDDPTYVIEGHVTSSGTPFGGNVATPRAFDTDEEEGALERAAMTDLDPNRDTPSFVYAGNDLTIDMLASALTSLSKDVMVNNDGYWSAGTYYMDEGETLEDVKEAPEGNKRTVYEGGQYAYRLRMMSDVGTISKDLVLYDSLENFYAGSYGTGEDIGQPNDEIDIGAHRWQGTLREVDVSQLIDLGCAPVVYYSEVENLKLSDETNPNQGNPVNMDLTNGDIWIESSKYLQGHSDLSGVKAVAIDASKTGDNTDFELGELESAVVILRMQAPSGEEARDICADKGIWGESAQAYNNSYLTCTSVDAATGASDSDNFIRKDYTKVGMKEFGYEVAKKWDDDNDRDGIRPKSITLNLYRNGEPATDDRGKPISATITGDDAAIDENGNWHYTFEHLPYTDPDGNIYHYSVSEKVIPGYSVHSSDVTDGSRTLTNKHVPERTQISGQKQWEGDEDLADVRPESITIQLYANGAYLMQQTVVPDAKGNWSYSFDNLFKYENGQEIAYTVREVPKDKAASYDASYVKTDDGYTITNTYHPYGDLKLEKTVEGATEVSAQREFAFTFDFTFINEAGEEEPLADDLSYDVLSADGAVISSGTLTADNRTATMTGGQTIHVKDIPEYAKYKITEEHAAGFTVSTSEGITGTIEPNKTAEASITNTYEAKAQFDLKALKRLDNRKMKNREFAFILYKVVEGEDGTTTEEFEAGASTSPKTTTTLRDDQTVEYDMAPATFRTIRFTQANHGKTYTYVVREVIPENATNAENQTYGTEGAEGPWTYKGVTYDEEWYTVKVAVTDNGNGTMKTDISYYDSAGNEISKEDAADGLPFENSYAAEGYADLYAWKSVAGDKPAEGQFEFELLDETGKVIDTKTNRDDAIVAFDRIAYDSQTIGKTFYYAIREVIPADATNEAGDTYGSTGAEGPWIKDGVIYDETVFGYAVTVSDNGDGTLHCAKTKVTPVLDDDGHIVSWESEGAKTPTFENGLVPGSLSVSKTIANPEDANPAQKFKFRVVLTGTNVTDDTVKEYRIEPISAEDNLPLDTASEKDNGGPLDWLGNLIFGSADESKEPRMQSVGDESEAPGQVSATQETAAASIDVVSKLNPLVPTKAFAEGTTFHATEDMLRGTAYAVLDGAGNMTAFRSENTYTNRQTGTFVDIKGNEYTGTVYTDIERGTVNWNKSSVVTFTIAEGQALKPTCNSISWFYYSPKLESVDVSRLDTSNLKYLDYMFNYMSSIKELDLSMLDVSNVVSMYETFRGSRKLESINLSGWNTPNLNNMQWTFMDCDSLKSIDLSSIDVSKVGTVNGLFCRDSSLTSVNLSGWKTSNIRYYNSMFDGCSSIQTIDLSGFDTSGATTFDRMFQACDSLVSLELGPGWNTANVTQMPSMFNGCKNLESLDLSTFDTVTKNTRMSSMFSQCLSLRSIELGSDFRFNNGTGSALTVPNTEAKTWIRNDGEKGPYTAAELMANYDGATMAGTWVWGTGFFKVSYSPGEGASIGSMAPDFLPSDADAQLSPNAFLRPGYEFDHWVDDDGKEYADGETILADTYENRGALNLTAVWKQVDTSVTMKDGAFEFSLHGGEKAVFDNIPAGTTYVVYEETPDGWLLVDRSNTHGPIESEEVAKASFTNKYQPDQTAAQLQGIKTLDGRVAEAGSFSFALASEDGAVIETVPVGDDGFFEFAPIQYEKKDIGTHTYSVYEVDPKDASIDYDRHIETVVVEVALRADGTLGRTITYDDDGIRFSNRTLPGELRIAKTAVGTTSTNQNDEFTFRVTLTHANGLPFGEDDQVSWHVEGTSADESDANQPDDGETSSSGAAVTPVDGAVYAKCKAGETIVIPDLPLGTTYEIEEVDLPEGWTQTGAIEGASGSIAANESRYAKATNTYSAEGVAQLEAHKLFEGGDLAKGQFEFSLYEGNELLQVKSNEAVDTEETVVETITDDEGNATDVDVPNPWVGTAPIYFDAIVYTVEDIGTHVYTIKETVSSDGTVVYDEHEEVVTVEVVDAGKGHLETIVTYDNDEALFKNRVKAAALKISKQTEGATDEVADTEFTFTVELFGADGSVLDGTYPAIKGEEEMSVSSGDSVMLKDGESITISDLPNGASYKVTEAEVTGGWEQAGAEGAEGNLTAGNTAEAMFTNRYLPSEYTAHGKAVITANKVLEATGLTEDSSYTFAFKLRSADGEELQTKELTLTAGKTTGTVAFDEIIYDLADAGKTFTYTVSEVKGDAGDVIYDKAIRTVWVSVGPDDGSGTLATTVRYVTPAEADDSADYTREATAKDTLGTLRVLARITSTEPDGGYAPGDTIYAVAYVFNDGATTLTNVSLSETLTGSTQSATNELAAGNRAIFYFSRMVTAEEALSGKVSFSVTAKAKDAGSSDRSTTVALSAPTESWIESSDASTFTNKVEHIRVTGTKTWDDSDDVDGIRPESITVWLLANKRRYASVEATKQENWTYEFNNLPVTDNGKAINYSVEEVVPEGYEVSYDGDADSGFIITNKRVPATTDMSITKRWEDANNQDGIRPTAEQYAAKVHLWADGVMVEGTTPKVTDNQDGTYTVTWSNLPKCRDHGTEIVYTATEDGVEGYVGDANGQLLSGGTITNTHTPATTKVSGSKTWVGDTEAVRPTSITVRLLADGAEVDSKTVTAADGWAWSWEGLQKYRDGGIEIAYAITEDVVGNYKTEVTGYDVINTYAPEKTSVSVSKAWDDQNDKDGIRPKSVSVRLLANGKQVGSVVTLGSSNGWTHTWSDLALKVNGAVVNYTVEETSLPEGYTSSVTGSATTGFHITNTHTPEKPKKGLPRTGDPLATLPVLAVMGVLSLAAGARRRRWRN